MPDTPEQHARRQIDAMLAAAGWAVQDYKAYDPSASSGIALREVSLKSGRCDYLLLVNRKPAGVVEAKKEGVTLSAVAEQSAFYAANLPDFLAAALGSSSLPFRDERDPHPRPRRVFCFHPFNQEGGLGKAHQLFGEQLPQLLEELNEALAA